MYSGQIELKKNCMSKLYSEDSSIKMIIWFLSFFILSFFLWDQIFHDNQMPTLYLLNQKVKAKLKFYHQQAKPSQVKSSQRQTYCMEFSSMTCSCMSICTFEWTNERTYKLLKSHEQFDCSFVRSNHEQTWVRFELVSLFEHSKSQKVQYNSLTKCWTYERS